MALKFLNNGYFAGKVGIGTESPTENLHVKTGSNTTVLIEGNQNTRFASLQFKHLFIDSFSHNSVSRSMRMQAIHKHVTHFEL